MPYEENAFHNLEDLEKIMEEELGEKKGDRREEWGEEEKKKSRKENISMIVCLSLAVLLLGISFGFSN